MNSDYRVTITWRGGLKRKKLQRKLGAEGVLAVMDLWSIAAEQRPDGILKDWNADDIELQINWNGQPGELVAVLVELRLLDFDDNTKTYSIHNWMKWNHWAAGAERRSEQARAAAEARWTKQSSTQSQENANSNAQSMPKACGQDADSNAEGMQDAMPLTLPYLTSPHPPPPPPPDLGDQEQQSQNQGGGGFENSGIKTLKPGIEEINEYIRLGRLFGGRAGLPPSSPPAWEARVRARILGQGGKLSKIDLEQVRIWERKEQRKKAAAQDQDQERAGLEPRTEEQEAAGLAAIEKLKRKFSR